MLTAYQQRLYALIILLLPAWACTQNQDPWDEWRNEQRSLKELFKDSSEWKNGFFRVLPDSNGFFYFRIDTSLGGLRSEMQQFFRFGPMEEDFLFPPEFRQFDQMFERFFRGMPRQLDRQSWPDFPTDDGDSEADDGLLPEERLRMQENPAENDGLMPEERLRLQERKAPAPERKKVPDAEPKDPPKKAPEVKTIRI